MLVGFCSFDHYATGSHCADSRVLHCYAICIIAIVTCHYSLVFGESVLNDAVAIVLFRTFLHEYRSHEQYTPLTLPVTLAKFVVISLGSLSVGALIGLSCSFLFKHTRIRDYPKYEISLLFLFAYGSYAFAEAIEMSVSATVSALELD
jgi:NhaP-type Na+/H+ or K+/H+ antiporter